MRKDRYLGHYDALPHGYYRRAITIQFALTLFLFSPLWLQPLHAAGSPPAASRASTQPPDIITSFLLQNSFFAAGPDWDFGAATFRSSAACSLDMVQPVKHTPMPLMGGKVLVAGWVVSRRISATAELYDPATDTWLAGGLLTSSGDRKPVFPRSRRTLVWLGIIIPF